MKPSCWIAFPLALVLLVGCASEEARTRAEADAVVPASVVVPGADSLEVATLAGGCFWCMEPPFEKLEGVAAVISGFTAGEEVNPTYNDVAYGRTSHTEAVQVYYDPDRITYEELLDVYWVNVDPTTDDRQFCDRGRQYRPGIYYDGPEQERLAKASLAQVEALGRFERVVVEVEPFQSFYEAEEYHQDFYKKNPTHYQQYRTGCGRDRRLQQLWGGVEL